MISIYLSYFHNNNNSSLLHWKKKKKKKRKKTQRDIQVLVIGHLSHRLCMVFCILINFPSPQSSDMPRAYSLLSYFVVQCITFERSILHDQCAALHINNNNNTQKLIEKTQNFVIRCLQCKQSTLLRSSLFFCISVFCVATIQIAITLQCWEA